MVRFFADDSCDLIRRSDRRILVVTETLGLGGTESHLVRTTPQLAELGWEIAIFCLTERGQRAGEVEAHGIKVFSTSPLARRKDLLRYPAHLSLAANRLYWLMRRWRPQIAHFYLPAPYLVGAPVAIAAHVPIKIMSRRSLSDYQQNWPIAARVERRLHSKMDAITGNASAVVRELINEGVPESRVRLIYNGIHVPRDFPDRTEARRALGLDDRTLVGVVIANLIPYKGHKDLIRGLSHIPRSYSGPWIILCAGQDHGLQAELEALAADEGVGAHVQFLGPRSDVAHLIAAADFGLLTPYGNEGFSNVILECMAGGLAMTVTDVGGNAEAVIDGATGFVVPPRNPEAISEAVLRLVRNPALCQKLGAAARKRVADSFPIDKCVQAHAELYEDCLRGARKPNSPLKRSRSTHSML